ncbi:MAG: hypothetical protein GY869_02620 [Planctomycetes bacterium]|nr:hypothetical protein [Planctomycetota bacterium]
MKSEKYFVVLLMMVVIPLFCPGNLWGQWVTVFYDDFDDGDISDWLAEQKSGIPATLPEVVSSPEGYSVRGVGSGYTQDPGLNVHLSQSLSLSGVGELRVEMRAISGTQWPNSAWFYLVKGADVYSFADYGEGNQVAQFNVNVAGSEGQYRHSMDTTDWHDFSWCRDADGWWSLSVDGTEVWTDFVQENQLNSFDKISLHILRNQSEIEWVKVSVKDTTVDTTIFYDDFDDGNISDWNPVQIGGAPANLPDVVASPEGYSVRGIGSGYTQDPGVNVSATQSWAISNVGALKVEMRAISGTQWPNSAWLYLGSGDDFYSFGDYGESNQRAVLQMYVDGQEQYYIYNMDTTVWHDFAWSRDADGWWSLSIDGAVVQENIAQDSQLTSFDRVTMSLLRNQSEIEWIRISAPIPSYLDLLSPDGGEELLAGAMFDIKWEYAPLIADHDVKIEYSLDNGNGWQEIGQTDNDGLYEWRVPTLKSDQYLIRITDVNDSRFFDTSQRAFSVVPCREVIPGDINGDCVVNLIDFSILANSFLVQGYHELYHASLDSDPLWQVEGEWAFGVPQGLGGDFHGFADPNSGNTGVNVYSVNPNGDYSLEIGGPYYLTAGPFSCKYFSNIKIKFARWLNMDVSDYTDARIEVSNDGVSWNTVWNNSDTAITDDSWNIVEYDIGLVADGEESVYIRWSYSVFDHAYSFSGWNIDDVGLWGIPR